MRKSTGGNSVMRIYHVKVTINGEPLEYDVQSNEELKKDIETYIKNGFLDFSVSRRDVA